ncbi:hypothetical protein O3Q51_14195 [Cryomorphaceae bacterium 1068]|nr:hypothetical protein [Cryomorphaceae bacterium 1068]
MSENIFHFRVLIDQTEEVFRDIQIKGSDSFDDLHQAIVEAFEFSGDEMASFYMSNEEWDKGEEITQMDMGGLGDEGIKTMKDTPLDEMVFEEGEKLLYLYDFMRMWIFFVELVGVSTAKEDQTYPLVVLTVGDAPAEHSKELVDSFPVDFDEDFEDPSEDEGFENIDDYDEII